MDDVPEALAPAVGLPSHPQSAQIKFTLRGHAPASEGNSESRQQAQSDASSAAPPSAPAGQHRLSHEADDTLSGIPLPNEAMSTAQERIEDISAGGDGPDELDDDEAPSRSASHDAIRGEPGSNHLPGNGSSTPAVDDHDEPASSRLGSADTSDDRPAAGPDDVDLQPMSPTSNSETPSRVPSPSPREGTPALSEALSETASVDTSVAGPPPETSAFELAHPLSAYQFANTTLVPIASTSTCPFDFVSWPPQPLEDSWQRTRLPDDDEAYLELDREAGYFATPEEIEASRARQAERQAKIDAKIARSKGKGKDAVARAPSKVRGVERASSADGAVIAPRRGRPPKSSLQQQVEPEPEVIRPRPIVSKTKYPRKLVIELLPDDIQSKVPAGIAPHPAFVDLLALPPHYIVEEGIPPNPASSLANDAKAQVHSLPPPARRHLPSLSPALPSRSSSAIGDDGDYSEEAPERAREETNGSKRSREGDDEGRPGARKRARESSLLRASAVQEDSRDPLLPEGAVEWMVQSTTCLSKKIDGQVRCFQCIARAIGHGCCFLGIRSFGVDEAGKIVGGPVFRDTRHRDDTPLFTKQLTSPLAGQFNELMRTWLAPRLLPIIEREQQHADLPDTVKIRLDLSVHSLCDTCNSSILGSEWMCKTCGRVACRVCHEALLFIEEQEAKGIPLTISAVESQRRKKCIAKKRGEKGVAGEGHRAVQFVGMSRLDKTDLAQVRADLRRWKSTHAIVPSDGSAKKYLDETFLEESPLADYDKNTYPVHQIPAVDLNEAIFLELWLASQPMLVIDVDLKGLSKWTPAYFASNFGSLDLQMVNNRGGDAVPGKVSDFFGQFNQDGGFQRSEDVKTSFRTKDFPSTKQFKREFRELHDEFYRTLPIRDILHPDGPMNFLGHTPRNAVQPDLGPRAMSSWAVDAATGTTMLRTDVTDVASLMYWGHHDEATGRELRIRWDVFRAEDADGLRDYCWDILAKKAPKAATSTRFRETHDDPLLSPCLYLGQRQREHLFATKGIKSFPVYQYPGQMILIPAGCPYQTSSWSDHLNLTIQFLAGPRLEQAIKTNEACRHETKERTLWRQDNVQLENQLLYTWRSCQQADKSYTPAPVDRRVPRAKVDWTAGPWDAKAE
ncbi:hypothetical protein JCM10212_007010 [Sporobolomyces blumeae]